MSAPASTGGSRLHRRRFLAGGALAAATLPAPAIAQGRLEWRMVTSWPKGSPGVGTGADRLAHRIGDLSGGRLTVKVHPAGDLASPTQCLDAVANGVAELGHDISAYHVGKNRASAFFTAIPFGLTASELSAWINWGGGQQLWDELYAPHNVKPFVAGNTGSHAFGWYKTELRGVDSLQGLRVRMPGLAGDVLRKLGARIVTLAGGELVAALESGTLDGAEWIGPASDLALGLHQVARHYYGPGLRGSGSSLELLVNRARFEALPNDLRQILAVAAQAANDDILTDFQMRNGPALEQMRSRHGVRTLLLPRDIQLALGEAATAVMAEERDRADPIGKRIFESYLAARKHLLLQTRFGEFNYLSMRGLPYRAFE